MNYEDQSKADGSLWPLLTGHFVLARDLVVSCSPDWTGGKRGHSNACMMLCTLKFKKYRKRVCLGEQLLVKISKLVYASTVRYW